jgi:OFA family oxalate/formate antiporter-like MFS transporter
VAGYIGSAILAAAAVALVFAARKLTAKMQETA